MNAGQGHFDAILFDLDDTLIDESRATEIAVQSWSEHRGIPADLQRWKAIQLEWFGRFERSETDYMGQRVGRIRDYLNQQDLEPQRALELIEEYFTFYTAATTAFDDAAPALRRARATGALVGVFTNGSTQLQLPKIIQAKLDYPWLELFTATDLGTPKPQAAVYELVAECVATQLGVSAPRILMVGDNLRNDVLAPLAAGWEAVYLHRGTPSAQGVREVQSLDELEF